MKVAWLQIATIWPTRSRNLIGNRHFDILICTFLFFNTSDNHSHQYHAKEKSNSYFTVVSFRENKSQKIRTLFIIVEALIFYELYTSVERPLQENSVHELIRPETLYIAIVKFCKCLQEINELRSTYNFLLEPSIDWLDIGNSCNGTTRRECIALTNKYYNSHLKTRCEESWFSACG